MARRSLPALFTLLSLLWGTFLFAALGITQRPFFADFALAVGRQGWIIFVAALILLAGVGVGAGVVRAIRLQATPGEQWLAAGLTGIGLLGTVWLWLGLLVIPPLPVTLLFLATGLFCLWRFRFPLPSPPPLSRWVWLYVFITVLLAFFRALHPAVTFDALLYHLRLPELWLAEGSLFPAPREPQFYFPVLIESLFTMALQLSGEGAAHLIHWGALPLVLLLLWQLTQRFMSTVSVGMVWIITLSIQMFPALSSWAYTDVYLAFFQVGVVWALLMWRTERQSGWLIVAGIGAGLALGVKYLALFTPFLAILMIAIVCYRHPREAIRAILLFGSVAAVVALPSYSRNFIGTGNPIFPFLLPTPYWDEFRSAWYAAAGTGIGFSLPDLLSLPYTVTVGIGDANYFDGRPGLVVSAFLPLALFLWAWRRKDIDSDTQSTMAWLLFFAFLYGLIWLFGVINSAALRQGRFLLPPLLLLTPVVAWGFSRLPQYDFPAFRPSFLARFLVAAWACFALLVGVAEVVQADPIKAVFTNPSRWQQEQWGPYSDLITATESLPSNARLLLWYEPRSYHMPTTVYPDTIVVQFAWRLREAQGDLTALDTTLCQEGFTHVAIYERGVTFMREEGKVNTIEDEVYEALQTWQNRHERVWIDEAGWYEIYLVGCAP